VFVNLVALEEIVEIMDVEVLVEHVHPLKLAVMEFVLMFVSLVAPEEIVEIMDVEVLVEHVHQVKLAVMEFV